MFRNRFKLALIASAIPLVSLSTAFGIIRHPDAYETSNGDPTGPTQWFAQWDANASGVAVGSQYLLTTRHQGGGVGSTVVFTTGANAGTYHVTQETLLGGATTDLRLEKLDRTLNTWAPLYTGDPTGKTVVLGGYGPTRNADIVNGSNQLIGYTIFDTAGNNHPLLLGQNVVDYTDTVSLPQTSDPWYGTPVLVSDFDGPESPPYSGGISPPADFKVDYEAGISSGDSGGGWFINNAGTFQLVGLTHAAQLGTVTVSGVPTPAIGFGYVSEAVDLTSFAPTITSIVPEPASLGLLALGSVIALRRQRH